MTSHRPTGLWLIGLAAFSSMASMRVCDPMLVALSHEFSVSVGEASRVVSAFAVAYGCLQLFYGPLGDRVGKLRVINAALLACCLFSALTAMATDFHWLVFARTAMGASAAGIIPLCMAWVGDQVSYERRQETLAQLMSATVTGMMAGQWFGGWAAESLGWRVAFAVLSGLFGLACVLLWVRLAPQRRAVPVVREGSYWQQALSGLGLLRTPHVRWVLAVTALEGALAFGTMAFVPSQLVQHFGLSASLAGGLMALYGVGGLAYSQQARSGAAGQPAGGRGPADAGLDAAGGAGRIGLLHHRPGFLHAAQHAADAGHANGAQGARQRGHAVRLHAVFWPVQRGLADRANRGPGRPGLGLHQRCGRHGGAGPGDRAPPATPRALNSGAPPWGVFSAPRTPPG